MNAGSGGGKRSACHCTPCCFRKRIRPAPRVADATAGPSAKNVTKVNPSRRPAPLHAMSTTIQRIPSLGRLSLSRGNSQHGSSAHGANAALLLLQQAAGSTASPRTLVLRACPARRACLGPAASGRARLRRVVRAVRGARRVPASPHCRFADLAALACCSQSPPPPRSARLAARPAQWPRTRHTCSTRRSGATELLRAASCSPPSAACTPPPPSGNSERPA
jgi:hypothetical protein